jgi:hypothetical protein
MILSFPGNFPKRGSLPGLQENPGTPLSLRQEADGGNAAPGESFDPAAGRRQGERCFLLAFLPVFL